MEHLSMVKKLIHEAEARGEVRERVRLLSALLRARLAERTELQRLLERTERAAPEVLERASLLMVTTPDDDALVAALERVLPGAG